MKKTKQGLAWQIMCIIVCIISVPLIILNLILTVQGTSNPDKLPSLFGYSPIAVMTGSMSPEFEANDLIFVKKVDIDTLTPKEDIICFVDKYGDYVTHRIERIETASGVRYFYTKGDANNIEDRTPIIAEQIHGRYVGKIPNFGGVVMYLQSPHGFMLTAILLIVLYIAGEITIEYIEKRKECKALAAENTALREENERLRSRLESQAEESVAVIAVSEEELYEAVELDEVIELTEELAKPEEISEIPEEVAEEIAEEITEEGAEEVAEEVIEEVIEEGAEEVAEEAKGQATEGRRRKVLIWTPDMTPKVNRKGRRAGAENTASLDEKLTNSANHYTREEYLALVRVPKKRIKTLIRHVDEHMYDEGTPEHRKKRQTAELWRDATLPGGKSTSKAVENNNGQEN